MTLSLAIKTCVKVTFLCFKLNRIKCEILIHIVFVFALVIIMYLNTEICALFYESLECFFVAIRVNEKMETKEKNGGKDGINWCPLKCFAIVFAIFWLR